MQSRNSSFKPRHIFFMAGVSLLLVFWAFSSVSTTTEPEQAKATAPAEEKAESDDDKKQAFLKARQRQKIRDGLVQFAQLIERDALAEDALLPTVPVHDGTVVQKFDQDGNLVKSPHVKAYEGDLGKLRADGLKGGALLTEISGPNYRYGPLCGEYRLDPTKHPLYKGEKKRCTKDDADSTTKDSCGVKDVCIMMLTVK